VSMIGETAATRSLSASLTAGSPAGTCWATVRARSHVRCACMHPGCVIALVRLGVCVRGSSERLDVDLRLADELLVVSDSGERLLVLLVGQLLARLGAVLPRPATFDDSRELAAASRASAPVGELGDVGGRVAPGSVWDAQVPRPITSGHNRSPGAVELRTRCLGRLV
jgi:hypothetical protein